MKAFHRFLRTVLPKAQENKIHQGRQFEPESQYYGGALLPTKYASTRVPLSVEIKLHLRAELNSATVAFRNQDDHGRVQEGQLYDLAHVVPEHQGLARQSMYKSLALCYMDHTFSQDFKDISLAASDAEPLFVKSFAYQAQPLLIREQVQHAGVMLTKAFGRFQFQERVLDVIPWGGFYAAGCDLDLVANTFVQPVLNPDASISFAVSGGGFWREQRHDPFREGIFHGYNLVLSSFDGAGSSTSLAENIRSGEISVVLKAHDKPLGKWRSRSYRYVSKADEIIAVTFMA